jgi:hypothetical protein
MASRKKITSGGVGGSIGAPMKVSQDLMDKFSAVKKATVGVPKAQFTEEMDAVIMHPEIGWKASNKGDFALRFGDIFGIKSKDTIRSRYRELVR